MGVSDEDLRTGVAASRSWRGVLRTLGLTSPRTGRELKARCDVVGIDYAHFRAGPSDEVVLEAVKTARTCHEAMLLAGYEEQSGSARAQLRKRCSLLGLSTEHLDVTRVMPEDARASLDLRNLRTAGPMLVAAHLQLAGGRVSWPLEPAAYDLLVEDDAGIRRVQVKTTTRRAGEGWSCGLTRSVYDGSAGYCVTGVYTRGEIDAFGIVAGDLSVYLIPFALLEGKLSVHLLPYEGFRLAFHSGAEASIR